MLNDAAVHAELKRIDPEYAKTWDALMGWMKDNPNDKKLPEEIGVFRLLAESQQALGKIKDKKPFKVKAEFGDHDCYQCIKLIRIARNAWRGGSNGREETVQ